MSFFKYLTRLSTSTQRQIPFPTLDSIHWRANYILRNRTEAELEIIANEIHELIEAYKQEYLSTATNNYIAELSENGGWELNYLDDRGADSESDIRELINNWPSYAPDKLSIPIDDMSDLEALEQILCNDFSPCDFKNFPEADEAELFAVLALLNLEYAALQLHIPEKRTKNGIPIYQTWQPENLIDAANFVIESTEIICYAERKLSDAQLQEMRSAERKKSDTSIKSDARKEVAIAAALVKNEIYLAPKDFVISKWLKEHDGYKDNKTAFAGDYVRIVALRYKDKKGDPLKIAYRTISDSWLTKKCIDEYNSRIIGKTK